MHTKFPLPILTLFILGASLTLQAQKLPTTPDTPKSAADRQAIQSATIFLEALRAREATVVAIVEGSEKPDAAILRLKAHPSPSGLKTETNTDFGMAAMEIGLRLVARNKLPEADLFFRESEKSFVAAVGKVTAGNARDKAAILQKLALLRGNYLSNPIQAKADIDAAIKLQPDEKYFQNFRDSLPEKQDSAPTNPSNQN